MALGAITLLALVMSVSEWKMMGRGGSTSASITVSGKGEVTAVPDIATVNFTVRESAKTVPEAQKLVEDKIKKTLSSLAALEVDEKDVKTLSYTVNPKYEQTPRVYSYTVVYSSPKIVGYEVAETVQVKVRKIDAAGEVIGALGGNNVTEISGPEFTVDDIEAVRADAKKKAIEDARAKAKETARSLGVSLGSIIGYSEDNGGYYPMYGMGGAKVMNQEAALDSVSLPQGENIIKSNVTITYSLD